MAPLPWLPLDLSEAKMGEDYAMYMKDHAMATVFCPEKKPDGGGFCEV